jgi:hypothetical protein
MFAYVKYGKHFALYAEFSLAFGARPFFGLNTCNGETIVDIPYGQIILTGGSRLKAETESHDGEKQYKNISASSARITED